MKKAAEISFISNLPAFQIYEHVNSIKLENDL